MYAMPLPSQMVCVERNLEDYLIPITLPLAGTHSCHGQKQLRLVNASSNLAFNNSRQGSSMMSLATSPVTTPLQ